MPVEREKPGRGRTVREREIVTSSKEESNGGGREEEE